MEGILQLPGCLCYTSLITNSIRNLICFLQQVRMQRRASYLVSKCTSELKPIEPGICNFYLKYSSEANRYVIQVNRTLIVLC